MALMMVSQEQTVADVENPVLDIAFPDSVVSLRSTKVMWGSVLLAACLAEP